MAMLIRRSVLGVLRRTGTPLPPASRQTPVLPSLAATFVSSSSAAGAAAAARIRGSPIRSKGQCMYRMLCDGNTQSGVDKPFLATMKHYCREFVESFAALEFKEKVITVSTACLITWYANASYKFQAELDKIEEFDRQRKQKKQQESDA